MTAAAGEGGIQRLLEVVRTLRGPQGCPWDREQTPDTLKSYAVEEAYELVDAVESGDPQRHRDELGDLLLQVALHAQIRSEQGLFSFNDVCDGLADKLIRRHPHVFGTVKVAGSDDVLRNWEAIKAEERGKQPSHSIVAGIPRHLPTLQKAERVQSRAAKVGFDWARADDVLAKVEEEVGEIRAEMQAGQEAKYKEELGDLLFAVVNLCRFLKVHPEEALESAVRKFVRRFQEVDRRIRESGREMKDCTLAEMDAHWDDVKRDEAGP